MSVLQNDENFDAIACVDQHDIVYRLEERARIRRQISTRKSVQEGAPDRLSDLLEEAAQEIRNTRFELETYCRQ